MLDSIKTVLELAKAIYDAAQLAEANKEQSQLIARRVRMLAGQIESLQGTLVKSPAKYERPLQLLVATLQDCSEFVQGFKKKGFLSRMLFGASHEAKFAQYNADVDRASADLQLGLGIDAAARQLEDRKAAEADSKQLQEMLRLQQRQEGHMQDMLAKQDELLQRLMAMQIGGGGDKPSPIAAIKKRFYLSAKQLNVGERCAEDDYAVDHRGEYLGEAVYIKRLKNNAPEVEQHFVREIAVISGLHHSHILSFYGACFERSQECLVFEAIQGRLSDCFKAGLPPLAQRLMWLRHIAGAVNYLHGRGIVHGDISTSSIVITPEDKAKLTNFGFASTQASTLKALGGSPLRIGLPWLAPERFSLSHKDPTFGSDVYSLGLLCWSLWTGKLPFTNCHSAADKSQAAHQTLLGDLPGALADVVSACVSTTEKRPSAIDVFSRLNEIIPRLIPSAPPAEAMVAPPNPEPSYQTGLQAEQVKDVVRARQCYEQAVAAGHVKARTNLAYFYSKGLAGLPKDEARALKLFTEAATTPVDGKPGHNRAMFNLGVCYQNGRGVAVDNSQARYWYQVALDNGYGEARRYLDAINAMLA